MPDDLGQIDVLERLMDAVSLEDAWTILTKAMASYGFDRLLYGMTMFRTGTGIGRIGAPEDLLILSNHDSCYLRHFVHERMFLQAPMLRWADENPGKAMTWRWLADHADDLSEAERNVVALNRAHDLVAGASISFRGAHARSRAVISLGAEPGMSQQDVDDLWVEKGREIKLVNDVAHLRFASLPYDGPNPLTRRQREVLEWVGEGKTAQDIATILKVSAATVEKHLRLAREALGVETTTQAVLKASLKKQIFTLED